MKKICTPYSYILVALASLIGLINYTNKSIIFIMLLSISLIGSLFLMYLDRNKFLEGVSKREKGK
ncbi:hypothetical protein EP18_14825 [Lysinibacillus sphaericus]|nr:hypothetical protein [Lysinibacillus sphaericus]KEK10918.1 hypothetical protein EP18_14825 [Lysinibacillus sphaericus]